MWASLLDTHRTSVSNTAWSPYVALKRFISRGSPVRYCLYPAFWHSSLKRNNHTVSDVDMYLHQSVRLCEDVAIYLIVMVMMMVTEPIIWYWLLLHKGRARARVGSTNKWTTGAYIALCALWSIATQTTLVPHQTCVFAFVLSPRWCSWANRAEEA